MKLRIDGSCGDLSDLAAALHDLADLAAARDLEQFEWKVTHGSATLAATILRPGPDESLVGFVVEDIAPRRFLTETYEWKMSPANRAWVFTREEAWRILQAHPRPLGLFKPARLFPAIYKNGRTIVTGGPILPSQLTSP